MNCFEEMIIQNRKIKVKFSYWENLIPKRCRKARLVRFDDGEVVLAIPSITATEAPVAIIQGAGDDQEKPVSYLYWGDRLWTPTSNDWYGNENLPNAIDITSEYRPETRLLGYSSALACPNKEQVIKGLQDAANNWLMIDGNVYRVTYEPRYVTMTFGLGSNHGGTALMSSTYYNQNIGAKSYFSLLQKEEAIARATQIATKRGDTDSLPIIADDFEVFIPAAIKLNPALEHGDGCEFLNSIESVAQASGGNPALVAATAISLALTNQ